MRKKIQKMRKLKTQRIVRMAEEESKTILGSWFTKSIEKHTEDNKAHRKHRHSEGDGYSLQKGK